MEASFLACLSARGLDITHIELIEQSSRRSILWPRAVFMATAQAIDPKSANLSSLARYFGYADHSSVSSVVRRTAPRALRRDETLRAASQATIDAYRHASRTIHIDSQAELSAA
jgi:chromosomal replication initiation ATPase DnaA